MTFLRLVQYKWALAYAVGVGALIAAFLLAPSPSPVPTSAPRSEPVREAVQQLLADEWLLNGDWSARAKQWPGTGPMPDATRQTLQNLWPELLADVDALQKLSAAVLQVEQIQKVQEQLRPYLKNAHPETRALAVKFNEKLQALLAQQGSASVLATVPITWAQLERTIADMDQMQETIRDFKRMSLSKELPDSAKLPMRVFVQLSQTFPTTTVRDFVTVGNRLAQRRWGLLYQLEKDRVTSVKTEVVAVAKPQAADWSLLALAFAGVLGTALLVRTQHHANQWESRCLQEAKAAQGLHDELQQARQAPTPEPVRESESLWVKPLAQWAKELPGLRSRIKNVQMRFDAGLALDLAAQDLTFIDEKLGEWDRHLAQARAETSGAHHG